MTKVLEVVTESGAVYQIDLGNRMWSKNEGPPQRLWELQVGNTLAWPWNCPTGWEKADEPVVGKHMYIASRDIFYVSTVVEEVTVL